MTLDETNIDRVRYEDLSDSLKALIDEMASFEDSNYVELRTNLSTISVSIDTTSSVCVGPRAPSEISSGKTVYFNSVDQAVQIAGADGNWVYLN